MILNGKALEDFIKWASYNYGEDSRDLAMIRAVYLNALIIEFFDYMGVWETVFYNVYIDSTVTTKFSQILNRAIIKANDIYNER